MWKAVLVLFIVSDVAPPSMMLGEFPEVFLTESDCKKFVASKRDDIKGKVEIVAADADQAFQVIGHRASCVMDSSGQPT